MKVSVVNCDKYVQKEVDKAIEQVLKPIGGMKTYVKPKQKVLIKINQLFGKPPEMAVTTHPVVVEAIINLVKSVGGIAAVGDSPGGQPLETVARKTGIKEICIKNKVPLVELDNPELIKFPKGKKFKSFSISKKIKDYDVIINVPKLKNHMLCGMT